MQPDVTGHPGVIVTDFCRRRMTICFSSFHCLHCVETYFGNDFCAMCVVVRKLTAHFENHGSRPLEVQNREDEEKFSGGEPA